MRISEADESDKISYSALRKSEAKSGQWVVIGMVCSVIVLVHSANAR